MSFILEKNEHVLLVANRHWFRPMLEIIMLTFSLLIPMILSAIVYSIPELPITQHQIALLSIIFILSWLFIVWNITFVIWTNHILDVVIVTNLHIFDIEQIGLWNREISTLSLEKIQDISSRTEGLIANLLDYGQLEIQTAGSISNFIVKNIQRPDLLREKITESCSH